MSIQVNSNHASNHVTTGKAVALTDDSIISFPQFLVHFTSSSPTTTKHHPPACHSVRYSEPRIAGADIVSIIHSPKPHWWCFTLLDAPNFLCGILQRRSELRSPMADQGDLRQEA